MRDDFIENLDFEYNDTRSRSPQQEQVEVPGMGEDPVMCPFCEKPLPPALFTLHNHQPPRKSSSQPTRPPMRARPATSTGSPVSAPFGFQSVPSSRKGSVVEAPPRLGSMSKLMEPLPVDTPSSSKAKPDLPKSPITKSADPSVTSETLQPQVSEGDKLNHAAAALRISEEDMKRWSRFAGVAMPAKDGESALETGASGGTGTSDGPGDIEKPPVIDRPSSGGSSRFGFFRKTPSRSKIRDNIDDSDSDDGGAQSGYAKLTAGGSDDENEKERGKDVVHDEPKGIADEAVLPARDASSEKESAKTETEAGASPIDTPPTPDPQELQTVLKEILAKMNEFVSRPMLKEKMIELMHGSQSQSHTALLTSQSTLLTSLKIARSNLAMAEANADMLEAQVKQAKAAAPRASVTSLTATPAPAAPATPTTASNTTNTPNTTSTANTSSTPNTLNESMSTTNASTSAVPTPTTSRRPSRDFGHTAPTANVAPAVKESTERARPTSIQIPPSARSTPAAAQSATEEKSGWGFWNGSRKRLTERLENFPSADEIISSFTPTAERSGFDFGSHNGASRGAQTGATPTGQGASVTRSNSDRSKNGAGKSASTDDLPAGVRAGILYNTQQEAEKLRRAYATAQKRMEGMTKELTELKKGKVDMEAELENLSQALFEEANKMVADERRKRAETEETLKELKAEKEALKQTVKLLNGSGSSVSGTDDDATSITSGSKDGDSEFDPDSFEPRDLDKHYEALRKSIHHVADGAMEGAPFGIITPVSPVVEAKPMEHSHSDPGAGSPTAIGFADPFTPRTVRFADEESNDDTIRRPILSPRSPETTTLDLGHHSRQEVAKTRDAPEGSIPDIIPIAANPTLEASVNVPDTIPEASPIMAEPNPWDETPKKGHVGWANKLEMPVPHHNDRGVSPRQMDWTADSSAEAEGFVSPKHVVPEAGAAGSKGVKSPVEELDSLMERLQAEELANEGK